MPQDPEDKSVPNDTSAVRPTTTKSGSHNGLIHERAYSIRQAQRCFEVIHEERMSKRNQNVYVKGLLRLAPVCP